MTPLHDVTQLDLQGTHLIEASAGTGKTWTLCALALRLILERDVTLAQLLLVTFSKAAASELRARLHERLSLAQHALRPAQEQARLPADVRRKLGDAKPFIDHALRTTSRTVHELQQRIQLALATFDEAAIHTIHAFFQRALVGTAFSAGQSATLQLVAGDTAPRMQAVADAWRRHVVAGSLSPDVLSTLYAHGDDPVRWAQTMAELDKAPLATVRWSEDPPASPSAAIDLTALRQTYAALRAWWLQDGTAIVDSLQVALANGWVAGRPTRKTLEDSRVALSLYFRLGDPLAHLNRRDVERLLNAQPSKQGLANGYSNSPPEYTVLTAYLDDHAAACQALARDRWQLMRKVLKEARESLDQAAAAQATLSFDDLQWKVHEQLQADPGLAQRWRALYPAILVDEFQDTDAVQWAIFRALDAPAAVEHLPLSLLVMVGDPKQAIYAFRGADLASYLNAARRTPLQWTLQVNRRASAAVVASLNALFAKNPNAMGDPDIRARTVKVGRQEDTNDTLVDRRSLAPDTPGAALQLLRLPAADDQGVRLTLTRATDWAVQACADWIAQTLRASEEGWITLGDRPLAGGDIAVLIETHKQGQAMREALARLGLASVERSQRSVFRSRVADDLLVILQACAQPGQETLLRAALATETVGVDAATLAEDWERRSKSTPTSSTLMDPWFDRMDQLHHGWRLHGVAWMLARLQGWVQATERLLPRPDGERWMTDWLHLTELLSAAELEHGTPEALVRWLAHQHQSPPKTEDRSDNLRLPSDRSLIKIVTIHAAKGLEYPIVVAPCLWRGDGRNAKGTAGVQRYHDDQGHTVLDVARVADQHEVKQRLLDEREQERLRMIYVALTRAKDRCVIVVDTEYRLYNKSKRPNLASPLNWLVAGHGELRAWRNMVAAPASSGAQAKAADQSTLESRRQAIVAGWDELATQAQSHVMWTQPSPSSAQGLPMHTPPPPPPLPPRPHPPVSPGPPIHRFTAPGPIDATWRATSFSAWARRLSALDEASAMTVSDQASTEAVPEDDFLRFPRGAAAGVTVHAVLERADLSRSSTWPEAITSALLKHPLTSTELTHERLTSMLMTLLHQLAHASLAPLSVPTLQLRGVQQNQRANELGFELSVQPGRVERLADTMRDVGLATYGLEGTLQDAPQGISLRGFIDQVFEHEGRWYLLDWKSNALGWDAQAYGQASMEASMLEHGYHLQHALYAVALWRQLVLHHGREGAASRFGGAFIIYLRGVRADWIQDDGRPCGVFHRRLNPDELDRLSAALGQAKPA
jgi:exodeoxyribonuclease V beta subunit